MSKKRPEPDTGQMRREYEDRRKSGRNPDGDEWPVDTKDLVEVDEQLAELMQSRKRTAIIPQTSSSSSTAATVTVLNPIEVKWGAESMKDTWSLTTPYHFCSKEQKRYLKRLAIKNVTFDDVVSRFEPKLISNRPFVQEEEIFLQKMIDIGLALHHRETPAGGSGDKRFNVVFYHRFDDASIQWFFCTLFHGTTWKGYCFVPAK